MIWRKRPCLLHMRWPCRMPNPKTMACHGIWVDSVRLVKEFVNSINFTPASSVISRVMNRELMPVPRTRRRQCALCHRNHESRYLFPPGLPSHVHPCMPGSRTATSSHRKPTQAHQHTTDRDRRETVAGYLNTYNKPHIRYRTLFSSVHKARSLIEVYRTLSLLSDNPYNSLPTAAHRAPIPCRRYTVGSDRLGEVAVSQRKCSTALVFGIRYSNAFYSGRRGDGMSRMRLFVFLEVYHALDDRAYCSDRF